MVRLPASESKPVDAPIPKRVSSIGVDRIQHLGTFITLYLPRCDGPALPPTSALMLALPGLPANSEVLLAAVDALSAAQLAVENRNHPLINRSRSLYGSALSHMLRAIQDPNTALKDETLLSTYLLTLYEVDEAPTPGCIKWLTISGICWCHTRTRLFLPCSRTSASAETAWTSILPKQTQHADFPCHTI